MKLKAALLALSLLLLGAAAWWRWQEGLVPVALLADRDLFEPAQPEGDQAQAALQILAPDSPRLRALLRRQALEPLVMRGEGGYVGLLAAEASHSRHFKAWRLRPRPEIRLQDGRPVVAPWLAATFAAWGPAELKADLAAATAVDGELRLRFRHAQPEVLERLADSPVFDPARPDLGTGSFHLGLGGLSISRHEGFRHGRAGFASLQAVTDPALMESTAWADGLAAGRWAWAVFPGRVTPDDMARARNAPYDEHRMKDGTVWFVHRKLRRLRTVKEDWTATPLFGVWQAEVELVGGGN